MIITDDNGRYTKSSEPADNSLHEVDGHVSISLHEIEQWAAWLHEAEVAVKFMLAAYRC